MEITINNRVFAIVNGKKGWYFVPQDTNDPLFGNAQVKRTQYKSKAAAIRSLKKYIKEIG